MMKLIGKYKNGNYTTFLLEDGTKIRRTKEDEFIPEFAENMDIKICNKCSASCGFCHEGSTPDGKIGDIMNEKFIETLHPYQEVAIGGGNIFEHPQLRPFLMKLKEKKVITNITVNQVHFEKYIKLFEYMRNTKLVYGIGISLVDPTPDFIEKVKEFPNAVIHVINGIFKESDYQTLKDNDLKLLILGYKHLRRGNDYFEQNMESIGCNQKWLYNELQELTEHFKVVSFDNLALDQLDVCRLLTDEQWEEFFMGDDSQFTYYIDMVERKFAKSSTAPMNERYDLLDSVDEMFEKIRK